MKVFYWLVTALLAVILIVFAVTNRNPAVLSLWPFPFTLQAPVYLITLLALLVGFLVGELVAWINGRRWRRMARRHGRRIEELERELVAAKAAAKPPSREIARD